MAQENTKDEEPAQESFKQQLDQEAADSRANAQKPPANPVIEKITEYIPAAAKILGGSKQPEEPKPEIPGPPERPHHDDKIEEFVRDQHRSGEGVSEPENVK